MYSLQCGISLLKAIIQPLTQDRVDQIVLSGVKEFEIAHDLLEKSPDGLARRALAQAVSDNLIKIRVIHNCFYRGYDISTYDPDTSGKAIEGINESVRLAKQLQSEIIVLHASGEPIEDKDRDTRLQISRERITYATEHCKKAGVRLAVEFLPRTCLGNTVEELFGLIDGLDTNTVGFCLDVNHLMDKAHELPLVVKKLAPRLFTLHISDYDGIDEKHWMPGKGVIDWKAFMHALEEIEYSGPFNYECAVDGVSIYEKFSNVKNNFQWIASL